MGIGLGTAALRAVAPAVGAPPAALLQTGALPAANVELAVFFVVGLLGGAHCLGMCGPLVTAHARRMTDSGTGAADGVLSLYEVRQHALFNLGRTVSYAALGALFGLAGAVLFDATATVTAVGDWVRAVSGVAVGLFILAVGARYLLGRRSSHGLLDATPLGRLFGKLSGRLGGLATGPGIAGLGLLHGLLPCPILYPAFLYAFARGSPLTGAVSLAVLGLGTVPTLFLYGTLVQSVDAAHRERLHRALGAAFLVMGLVPLSHGLHLAGVPVPHFHIPIYQPL